MRSLIWSVLSNEFRRRVFRCYYFIRSGIRKQRGDREKPKESAEVINSTLNVRIIATWKTPSGEIKRWGYRIRRHLSWRTQFLEAIRYLEIIDAALAGNNEERNKTIILGLPERYHRDRVKQGLLVSRSATLEKPKYECRLESALSTFVPNYRLTSTEKPESLRHDLILNPHHHLQTGEIPPEIVDCVGNTHALSNRRPILWIKDPGTEFLMPFWLTDGWVETISNLFSQKSAPSDLPPNVCSLLAKAQVIVPAECENNRREEWDARLAEVKESLTTHYYAVVRDLINPLQIGALRNYYDALAQEGYLTPSDGQVAWRDVAHNEPLAQFFHQSIANLLNRFMTEKVKPSYCYLARYLPGAVLHKHKDREQCAWNMSLVFDSTPSAERDDAWPIYVEVDGQVREIRLGVGEALLYRGTQIPHWREALPAGHSATICFYHFVPNSFVWSLD